MKSCIKTPRVGEWVVVKGCLSQPKCKMTTFSIAYFRSLVYYMRFGWDVKVGEDETEISFEQMVKGLNSRNLGPSHTLNFKFFSSSFQFLGFLSLRMVSTFNCQILFIYNSKCYCPQTYQNSTSRKLKRLLRPLFHGVYFKALC